MSELAESNIIKNKKKSSVPRNVQIDFQSGKRYIDSLKCRMIAENVANIREQIASACERAGRSVDEVTLVAVSKAFESSHIREAVEAGVFDVGENYVQELSRKRGELRDERVRWHFVGHLQRNKVKYVAEWIHLIHSVDSLDLGREINKQAYRHGRTVDVLIEVNTSGEKTKHGVHPNEVAELAKGLKELPNLLIRGLMTIGPFLPDPDSSRPAFRMLREIKDRLEDKDIRLSHLSMGMTNDFKVAIEEGATIVRVGTGIFGERQKKS
jgi:pyridoxal phosphate enzyme (YggS family)